MGMAQGSSSYFTYDADLYNTLERLSIKQGGQVANRLGTVRPYLRSDIAALVDSSMASSRARGVGGSTAKAQQRFFQVTNTEFWPDSATRRGSGRTALYKNEADVFSVRTQDFDLHLSPAFYGGLGKDQGDINRNLYTNTRGIELRGTVDKRVSFYSFLADNQVKLPGYQSRYADSQDSLFPSLPYEAFVKPDPSGVKRRGYYDFITARGHIAVQATKHIAVAFGQDRHFVGDGMRSLIWSDWSPANPYLKLETSVWRIRYTNIFSQLKAGTRKVADGFIPNKWAAFHQLDIDISRSVKLGLFETVVFAPGDSNKRGLFDLSYLNPVIFYRFAEQYNGSTDNSLVGANLRVDVARQLRFYSQLVFDELRVADLRAQKGWWGNKYAIQLGAKWIDPLGLNGLDLQGEFNLVRPFTYTHQDKYRSYTNFGLPLAHPAGANFTELTGRFTYQLSPTLRLLGRAMLLKQGDDTRTQNYGQNINRSYQIRARDSGNELGQGIAATTTQTELTLSYMPWHRLFIDAGLLLRTKKSDEPIRSLKTQMLTLAVRWNIASRAMWY